MTERKFTEEQRPKETVETRNLRIGKYTCPPTQAAYWKLLLLQDCNLIESLLKELIKVPKSWFRWAKIRNMLWKSTMDIRVCN